MFIVRDDRKLSRLDRAQKVIKAQDFWAYQQADAAVAEALRRREEILLAAQQAFEAERERGYAEGCESARLEQSGTMVEIATQTVQYYGKVEMQMADLVLEAVRKVVTDFDDRERVASVVRSCLDLVRTQKQLSLSVHPSQVEFLRDYVEELRRDYPSIAQIDVHPDAKLDTDGCLVESDIGIVEASLAKQVEVLRETLSAVFAPKPPASEELAQSAA